MRLLLRRSAVGALLGGAAFLGLGIYMNRAIGAGPLEHLGPLGFTVVVGATIGGLVAPLFRWRRSRGLVDVGLTHVALEVTDLDRSIEFYARYAKMEVVHRRAQATDPDLEIAWLSDRTRGPAARPFRAPGRRVFDPRRAGETVRARRLGGASA